MKPFETYCLLLTENCNLSCKYCYEVNSTGHKRNNMSVDTATKAVEFMFSQSNKHISVSFFGGEPTLMPDIIDVVCNEGKRLSKIHNKTFSVSMITNATIMNEKLYNIISSHLDIWTSTQLSVDGPHDIQDANRVTKSGEGTFATIEANLPYWKELFPHCLTVHGVLSKSSIPRLYESYIYFREVWKENLLWFIPAKSPDYTHTDIDLYDRELGKIYEYIMTRVRESKSVKEIEYYAPLDRALKTGRADKPCGAGSSYCVITADGKIWPCHHFYYIDTNQELLMGDIYDGVSVDRKRLWDEYDQTDMVGCEDCEHTQCYRCIAENYEEYQHPFMQSKGVNDTHCAFMKIDLKYQRLIKKEIDEMGLTNRRCK